MVRIRINYAKLTKESCMVILWEMTELLILTSQSRLRWIAGAHGTGGSILDD